MSSTPSTAMTSANDPQHQFGGVDACETPKTNGGNSQTLRCFIGEQGKRARFYRNGDQFFKGLWYTVSAFRSWDALLEDLNQHLGDSISLPHGVRFVFTVDGLPRFGLENMEHGQSYVCSSTDKFKAIDYANASQPMWSFVSAKLTVPPKRGIRATFDREPNDFVRPRIITVIRNGLKPRRVVRHLLNKRTAQSFHHVMQDITAIVKLNSGVVRKLYALSGKQVTALSDFFGDDHVFVAYGPEKISVDDFEVLSEEYKRMNMQSGRRMRRGGGAAGNCTMPLRNDGFQKTLSPDPKNNLSKAMKLPPQLESTVKIIELLGDGNTALVFKAVFRDAKSCTSTTDALKIISKENADDVLDFVETEIKLMSEIKHPHIVEMRDYQVIENSWYIRMELIQDGDLFEYLRKERTLSESNSASCISCLCQALDYLHSRNIVHRDVKPENLLTYTCPSTGLLMLKLADFGLACRVEENELLYRLCGTPTYVAPEVLAEFGYSFKADCWSTGIILYILLCGFPPFGFDEDEVLFNKILRGEFDFPSPSFDNTSYASRYLIRCLLYTEPKTRFSARQVLDYFWVQNPGAIDPASENQYAADLEEAMASFNQDSNEFEESDTEYFYSRRASMDQFSDCTKPDEDDEENEGEEEVEARRSLGLRQASNSSFVYVSSQK